MGTTKGTNRSSITAGNSSKPDTDKKYYVYSSKAGKNPGATVQVLTPDTNTDKFVSSLKDQVIILEATPNPVADFDASDEWSKWLTKFDPKGKFSLKVDDTATKNIQSFEFKFTSPWDMTFSSSTAALNFSFGAPAELEAEQARMPVPGLDQDGSMLYCGLDVSQTGVLTSTVKEIFEYAGLAAMVSFLPSSVSGLSITLDAPNASKQHNAMWFKPSFGSQTTVRLQFKVDVAQTLQDLLKDAIPGFKIQSADAICKKVLVKGETTTGPVGVEQGQVMFTVECSVKPKDSSAVNMIAGIEFQESAITLTFQLGSLDSSSAESSDPLSGILLWLGGLISDDLGFIKDLLNKDSVFKHINLRRMTIGLDTSENTEKPTLSKFGIDIEVSATFGQGSDLKPVVFLVTYTWTSQGGKLGFIRGQLWNCKQIPLFFFSLMVQSTDRRANLRV